MTAHSYALQARARKMQQAQAIGIDESLISRLVERFYDAVRHDDLLGPVFNSHIDDWASHLARMKDFWASMTLESGRYHGNPMLKHIAIGTLGPTHFDRWLEIWNRIVEEVAPTEDAAEAFRSSAKRIAASLLMAIQVQRGEMVSSMNKRGHST
ncbi:MAG: group III truncated hemoglobin [Alphaproteobacteria bacterium]